jgi:hypothetical protein
VAEYCVCGFLILQWLHLMLGDVSLAPAKRGCGMGLQCRELDVARLFELVASRHDRGALGDLL